MKATKRGASWTTMAHVNGISKRFTGQDRRQVLAAASQWINDNKNTDARGSFRAACESFFRDKEDELSPATLRGYNNIFHSLVEKFPAFCSREVIAITTDDLESLVYDLDRKCHYSNKTIKNYIGFVGTIFTYKRMRMPFIKVKKATKTDIKIPDEDMVRQILEIAWQRNDDHQLWICLTLAACGPLRRGEIAALTRDDVDFDSGSIHVSHDMVRDREGVWHIKDPKTPTSDRVLAMPGKVVDEIRKQGFRAKHTPSETFQEPIYVTSIMPDQIYNQFTRMLAAHDLPHYRLHDLRHYCASILHAKGYPDKYIELRTGHAGDEILRRVYTHAIGEEAEKMEKSMVSYFDTLV